MGRFSSVGVKRILDPNFYPGGHVGTRVLKTFKTSTLRKHTDSIREHKWTEGSVTVYCT